MLLSCSIFASEMLMHVKKWVCIYKLREARSGCGGTYSRRCGYRSGSVYKKNRLSSQISIRSCLCVTPNSATLTAMAALLSILLRISIVLFVFCRCAFTEASNSNFSCPEDCSQSTCLSKEELGCAGGVVLDRCLCCQVCAKVKGESCGGRYSELGICDVGLACVETRDTLPFSKIRDYQYRRKNRAGKCLRKCCRRK